MPGPGRCLQAAALPTFFSPFDWRLVRQQSDGYELRDVRLGRGTSAADLRALTTTTSGSRERVGRRPAARSSTSRGSPPRRSAALPDGTHRVRAMDMRFLGPTATRPGARPAGARAVRDDDRDRQRWRGPLGAPGQLASAAARRRSIRGFRIMGFPTLRNPSDTGREMAGVCHWQSHARACMATCARDFSQVGGLSGGHR